jgi:AAT family amino acid transporter
MFINPETRVSVTVGAGVLVLAAIVYAIKHRKKK